MPISHVQQIVFASKTFADAKRELLNYAATKANAAKAYNLTTETINTLFEAY